MTSPITNATASFNIGATAALPGPPATSPAPTPTTPVSNPSPPPATAPGTVNGTVTDLGIISTDGVAHTKVPVTFGQVFAPGDLAAGTSLSGKMADGTIVPLQLDVKALHADGSVRHAIISSLLPSVGAAETRLNLARSTPSVGQAATAVALLAAGFTSTVTLNVDGQSYSASADSLLKSGTVQSWLSGPVVSEWLVSSPLKNAGGVAHPHLTARYAIRWYNGTNTARVDLTIENNWAYEAGPQNFTYDANVVVGGKTVYTATALNHAHHARWRKVFWWGDAPAVHVKHNAQYLIASQAVPNYDQTITVPEATLAGLAGRAVGAKAEPMGTGLASPYMPDTGGRWDIGLLPGWSAVYLLSMDKRAKDAMLATTNLAGSWSSHYRDRITDKPVSLMDYPYMTLKGDPGDTINPATGKSEMFPGCATGASCNNTNADDTSHQPAFAYLPYLVTGDYYYLEELQFWAMYDAFSSNPGYRDNIKGLLKSDQIRGQAWSLRTLAEAAYISPTQDRLKGHFETIVSNNLDWYNTNYTNNASANTLGVLSHGYAMVYNGGAGLAPWQDDFFTAAVGHAAELGFSKAQSLLLWKSKFPIERMVASDACYISAAMYAMNIRDSATGPFYSTYGQVYAANVASAVKSQVCGSAQMGAALGLGEGEMVGYAFESTGYPSNLQPALAYSATVGGKRGAEAWAKFAARSVKPNYGAEPQFAIVPR